MQIIMTREVDTDITLQQRCNIANQSNCDLFISIHCNSFSNPSVTGTEIFYYTNDSKGYDFATVVNNTAVSVSKNNNRGVKPAHYYVISNTTMTAILLECAFISNPDEEDMLNNPDWQDNITEALAASISKYCGYNYTPSQPDNPDEIPESIPGIKEIVQQPVGYDEYLIEEKRRVIHLNKYNILM
jgi:N-acetylmuramoyl-L-alanine amidase